MDHKSTLSLYLEIESKAATDNAKMFPPKDILIQLFTSNTNFHDL